MEVCNSFEINYKEVDGKIKIDMEYFDIKQDQCMFALSSAPRLSSVARAALRSGICLSWQHSGCPAFSDASAVTVIDCRQESLPEFRPRRLVQQYPQGCLLPLCCFHAL